jgi:hypothetical protein
MSPGIIASPTTDWPWASPPPNGNGSSSGNAHAPANPSSRRPPRELSETTSGRRHPGKYPPADPRDSSHDRSLLHIRFSASAAQRHTRRRCHFVSIGISDPFLPLSRNQKSIAVADGVRRLTSIAGFGLELRLLRSTATIPCQGRCLQKINPIPVEGFLPGFRITG